MKIEVQNLTIRLGVETEPVFTDIKILAQGGEFIGVVGRVGSGKVRKTINLV